MFGIELARQRAWLGDGCLVYRCVRRTLARGYCDAHYRRWHRGMSIGGRIPETLREQFDSKWFIDPHFGCWIWTAATTLDGYGRFRDDSGRLVYAHRWAYENYVGHIPDGLTLDHLCRQPPCVNPSHLEPGTIRENVRRGFAGHSTSRRPGRRRQYMRGAA